MDGAFVWHIEKKVVSLQMASIGKDADMLLLYSLIV